MKTRAKDGGDGSGPGSQRVRDRMYKLAEQAYKDADHKFQPTAELFRDALLTDERGVELMWELLHIYYPQRFSALFAEIAKRHHRKIDPEARKAGDQKAAGKAKTKQQQKSYVDHSERVKAMRETLLRTKLIQLADGAWISLYDATKEQALSYAERLPAEALAIKLLVHPMPTGGRIGDYYPDSADDEVREIWRKAQDQTP